MKLPCLPELNHTYWCDHVPNMRKNASYRVSSTGKPIPKHSSHTSISLSLNRSMFTEPSRTSPMSLYDYQSRLRTPLISSPETRSLKMRQETVTSTLTLDDEPVYRCYLLGQLQGSYLIETLVGPDQVSVIVPSVHEGWEQYAIVRRICSSGLAIKDQFIYQQPTQFILCSLNGKVKAILKKGSKTKHSVRWKDVDDGSLRVWWRKENVTLNFVRFNSLASSRRNSACSSGSSTDGSSHVDMPGFGASTLPFGFKPEFLQNHCSQIVPIIKETPSNVSLASSDGFQRNMRHLNGNSISTRDDEEQAMFELIKAHCMGNNNLRKKMVHWAMKHRSVPWVSPRDISNISKGRLWITAHAADSIEREEIVETLQESLNDIKGAYKQVKTGLYKQPEPQGNDSGVQHRLRKEPHGDPYGYWKIEAYDLDSGKWKLCAKELPDGRWVDLRNSELIRVLIVPMNIILHKMGEEFVNGNQYVSKSIEFLFTSCNQKRLNSKLNRKNLRHNINNLKVRLRRQHALTFAVKVASTADAIAQELEAVE